MMEDSDQVYSPVADGDGGAAADGDDGEFGDMSSAARAARLLRLGAGADAGGVDDDLANVDLEVGETGSSAAPGTGREEARGGKKQKKKSKSQAAAAAADAKPLGLWRLGRGDDGALQLARPTAPGGGSHGVAAAESDDVELEVRMPPLKRRIAMNLSLAEQPHNGIELNGERLPGEPLVGSTGTTFHWGAGDDRVELKIMATKKVPFAHGCDHDTRYLLFINGCEAITGKPESLYWWEINFRLVVIGLSGILIFLVGLGLSYIPEIGVVGAYALRVTGVLGVVGLYELVVGLVSLSKMHGRCALKCLCKPHAPAARAVSSARYASFESR